MSRTGVDDAVDGAVVNRSAHGGRNGPRWPSARRAEARADGGDTWLRSMRVIGVTLPVLFIVTLELIRRTFPEPVWPGGQLVLTLTAVPATVAFGLTMFSVIGRAHRLVLAQNRQLAAVRAVAEAVTDIQDVDQVLTGALDAILTATGAVAVTVTATLPADCLSADGPVTWRRVVAPDDPDARGAPLRNLDVPLSTGAAVVGTLTLDLPDSEPDRLTAETLQTIGRHLGSALQRAQLITHLRHHMREGQALHQTLLQISGENPLTTTLVSLAQVARDLLRADEAGVCLTPGAGVPGATGPVVTGPVATGPGTTGPGTTGPGTTGEQGPGVATCIAADGAGTCDDRRAACPARALGAFPASLSVPLRSAEGSSGLVWLCRRSDAPFTRRDQTFLTTLSELAVVALHRARMAEDERQDAVLAERLRAASGRSDGLVQALEVTHARLCALVARPELAGMTAIEEGLRELIGTCHAVCRDAREMTSDLPGPSGVERASVEDRRLPGPATPVRVLLIDDQPLLRLGIATLVDGQDGLAVVGQAATGPAGIETAQAVGPDVVVLNVGTSPADGVETARLLRERLPGTKVIALVAPDADGQVLRSVRAGVDGCLPRDVPPDRFCQALRGLLGDRDRDPMPVPADPAHRPPSRPRQDAVPPRRSPQPGDVPVVSRRQLEILQLVADGLSNKQIGRRLSISEGTVKSHIHNALQRLQMENRIQAAAYIVRQGLGRPPGTDWPSLRPDGGFSSADL